jgi:hypothetical protein
VNGKWLAVVSNRVDLRSRKLDFSRRKMKSTGVPNSSDEALSRQSRLGEGEMDFGKIFR